MNDDLWSILLALENNTRREMLKTLSNYDSYALELSRMVGVSQQAINKQLEILEKLGLISTDGSVPSIMGPPRKIYKSMGFSTIIIDYSKNFMSIKKMDFNYAKTDVEGTNSDLINEIKNLNRDIEEIDRTRNLMSAKKDAIIGKLKERAAGYDNFYRKIINEYLETMDVSIVGRNTGIPNEMVVKIIEKFMSD
ncbi:ArsR family transcriptional regulator [Ferroplasma sp.]|uniref:ArsR/SmtB family transcription factor n=1 Tax=Ferroplasma sp. TaxID=2591003 RepID=UPI00307F3054